MGCQLVAWGNACQDSEAPQWASPLCLLCPNAASSSWIPKCDARPAAGPQPDLERGLMPTSQTSALTALALAPALGLGWLLTLAMKGPVPHSDWASKVSISSERDSAKQNQVAVMAAVLLRGELTISLASWAGWSATGEGQLQGPELGACLLGLLPDLHPHPTCFLLHADATES